ncbi:VOC family protein [Persicimonas caeni]|uniref:VOC family protein n=1 Tax=Persicimonas caeni TaxID=2292766 RepID=A0A4Y6PV14_PERCE|nr:VOC family protein [Persicimonas caeni]QDG52148.1 VOC family protein [Persicimonas caeni]QED33370.1 VOC family protein [Persicimonas caeni]
MQQITFLQVDDLTRTDEFYGNHLGLEIVLDQGACHIYRVGEDAFLGFCDHKDGPAPDGIIVTLVRDDVDAFCAQLEEAGVEIESGPKANERFQIYQAFVRDPDGYLIEIQRFDDPRWPQT